ncbi:hypothetical protein EVAR_41491_1 [Eumeta japonica]|uniref:Reverse transcriptase domain-containing protein n=1 Tax=Eumeta variegata TaxID=151549 RepID=A0A4C1X3N0_EUMVA|nr:hypothetical protein EVAR_41491_1 [Eumeta japonica]
MRKMLPTTRLSKKIILDMLRLLKERTCMNVRPPGSIIVLDSLLPEIRDLGVYVQAFADDVVLMFSGQSASVLEAEANRALAYVKD